MKKFFFGFVGFIILLVLVLFTYLYSQSPKYSGEIQLKGLKQQVTIRFDQFGIPHIYADNETDAYFALGYVQAQERLFQMEMLRRVASGQLSEILGPEFVETDKLFRTLGIEKKAQQMADRFKNVDAEHKDAACAYFEGINSFIENGNIPLEFKLMGIPVRKFEIVDSYRATGFMALGFAEGFKLDPLTSKIYTLYGPEYLENLGVHSIYDSTFIPNYHPDHLPSLAKAFEKVPIPFLMGSNSWIVGPSKSASGKPIFENDTHIGFSQPAVWYDAHLEYPGHSYYGQYLSSVPFGLLGHNSFSALGLTMFENDDVDYFEEKISSSDLNKYVFKDTVLSFTSRTEEILVKNEDPVSIKIRETHHGPIMNDIFVDSTISTNPVSVWWAFLEVEKDLLGAIYQINHSQSISETQKAVANIEAPGLNVMYADIEGNIAWWAAAKMPIRPERSNSKLILDGSGPDEYLGFYNFSENPRAINPPWGYVYSANNQPDSVNGVLYPGYYLPMDRGRRISDILNSADKWNSQKSMTMTGDVMSPSLTTNASILVKITEHLETENELPIQLLSNWDGNTSMEKVEPTIYYTFLSWILYYAMGDELGPEDWQEFVTSSIMKRSYHLFLQDESSKWWDDISTPETETRDDIVSKAYTRAISTIEYNTKSNSPDEWQWMKVHKLTHKHPLGNIKILSQFFDVGPFDMDGGNETINNQLFKLDTLGIFNVTAGPSMRTVIDLSDMNQAVSILPTGQSGNFMSPHYQDQALMYANGEFRPQLMDSLDIMSSLKSELTLKPSNDE